MPAPSAGGVEAGAGEAGAGAEAAEAAAGAAASWPRPLGTGFSSAGTPSAGFSPLISSLISPGVWAVEQVEQAGEGAAMAVLWLKKHVVQISAPALLDQLHRELGE